MLKTIGYLIRAKTLGRGQNVHRLKKTGLSSPIITQE
jgi:hypothetical protein